jgi:hypothetical protein
VCGDVCIDVFCVSIKLSTKFTELAGKETLINVMNYQADDNEILSKYL